MEQMPQSPLPPQNQPQNEPLKPVAYDTDGNPLYAAPVQASPVGQANPQVVYMSRPLEPAQQEVSPEIQKRHEQSVQQYPSLSLSPGEYVISAVRRHLIGLFSPIAITVLLIAVFASLLINYPLISASFGYVDAPQFGPILLIGFLLIVLFAIGGYISVWVYRNNRFFLTNEGVIQELQLSLFARKEQMVSLANIEDASFDQRGIIQMLFNYGSIRLSTEGDETTYRFSYVSNPRKQIELLNNAIESFKNGRPIKE